MRLSRKQMQEVGSVRELESQVSSFVKHMLGVIFYAVIQIEVPPLGAQISWVRTVRESS
jgi:hypothetical protein